MSFKVQICIGTACHMRCSQEVIRKMEELVKEHHMEQEITLAGCFCAGECSKKGVTVMIDKKDLYKVTPDTVEEFFQEYILG